VLKPIGPIGRPPSQLYPAALKTDAQVDNPPGGDMIPKRPGPERRRFPRQRVRVAVFWYKCPDQVMAGELCDVSACGVFLVSLSALPEDVGVGDTARITLRTSQGEETLIGTVRWRGYHPAYEAIGCGILLDEASRAVICRLFPTVRPPDHRPT
jgi:hypothetical protein